MTLDATPGPLPSPLTDAGALPLSIRRAWVACLAGALGTFVLMLPALVNGFPFLFYDSGGYLSSAFAHEVTPGRSTVYGLWLLVGSRPDFWPVAFAQTALSVWVMHLVLRVQRLPWRPALLVGLCALLSFSTALPFVSAELMPDIFSSLCGLALYLLLWCRRALRRAEAAALVAILAVGGASHNSALAVEILAIAAAGGAALLVPGLRPRLRLVMPMAGVALAVVLIPLANAVVAGRFTETPGGSAFIFGRLLEDGVVARYLDEHCPAPGLTLCVLRSSLPRTADDFLWDEDATFQAMGGFEAGAPEMRRVVLGSLRAYPFWNLWLAVRATARQFVALETGDLMSEELEDSYDAISEMVPRSYGAMEAARQQRIPPIDFDRINALQQPVALLASFSVVLAAAWLAIRRRTEPALLAASVTFVLVANAAVCGVLSNPHDRYQSRIVWIAVFALAVIALSGAAAFRRRSPGMR